MPQNSHCAFLAAHPKAILVDITDTQGSVPRETGAFMLVAEHSIWGTIGGGPLEFIVVRKARELLSGIGTTTMMDIPLGPEIGQCCGGRVRLRFNRVTETVVGELEDRCRRESRSLPNVFIFGAGHVGQALATALARLPIATTIIDTRREILANLPAETRAWSTSMPEAVVRKAPSGAALVILTHDHELDFRIARKALERDDLAYVGMIGSASKRECFSTWFTREAGVNNSWLERLTLPIGGSLVKDKRPAVIAAMVTAEIFTIFSRQKQR